MLSGWFGLCTGLLPNGIPVEAEGYDRVPVWASGTPLETRLERIPGPRAPLGAMLTHGGLWEEETGGRCLVTFGLLPPHVEVPNDVQAVEVTIHFEHRVQLAINASMLGGADAAFVEKGAVVGTWNGQTVRSTTRLAIVDGAIHTSAKAKTSAKVNA
jgi:hypothetical protein